MSVVSWLRSTPASRGTPITTSAKLSPPASRTRTERTSLTPGTERAARSTRPATPDGVRSISASMFWRASRSAPNSTIAATKMAASESPAGTPAATRPRPTSTARVPAKSEPKCHAFAMRAAFRSIRPRRSEIAARAASTTSTTTSAANAYQRAWTGEEPSSSLITASTAIHVAAAARNAASPRAARCWALPWPNGCSGSAGRSAIPTAYRVRPAAAASMPECTASARIPRLPLAKPTASLRSARPIAATSDATAVRRAGDIGAVYGGPVSFSPSEVQ